VTRLHPPLPRAIAAASLLVLATGFIGCSKDDVATQPPDSTPPDATSLRVDAVSDTSITLSWRAPGGDGMRGLADRYDLRYATTRFDEDTWALATSAKGLNRPSSAGSLERHRIAGLSPGLTYFFAIRSVDGNGNWSPMSGLINLSLPSTLDHPVLWTGDMIPGDGTISTAFVYRVRVLLRGEEPLDPPAVVVGGVARPMRRLDIPDIGSAHYEFSSFLDAGSYDYYFSYTDPEGRSARLPNPGTWAGPVVGTVETFIPDFVAVSPDTFAMGSPYPFSPLEERPRHTVILNRAFQVDRLEITNAQLCAALNWAHQRGMVDVLADTLVVTHDSGRRLLVTAPRRAVAPHGIRFAEETGFTPLPFRENWPATYVTWYGAVLYCNVRTLWEGGTPAYDLETWRYTNLRNDPYLTTGWRLPTEAEWEYVAQYNDARTYPFGNRMPEPGVDGNFAGAVGHCTTVGSYPGGANALGVRDLAGNVWEWCSDRYGPYPSSTVTNPLGPSGGDRRAARGGSWGSRTSELECYQRFSMRPDAGSDGLGFRCVRVMP